MGLGEREEENLFQNNKALCTRYNKWFENGSHPSAAVLPAVHRPVAVTSRAWSMMLRKSFVSCNNRMWRVTGGTRIQALLL